MADKFIVSSSPHIATSDSTARVMLDVIIALLPAAVVSGFFFGFRAWLVILTAVISCVGAEYIYQLIYIGFKIKDERRTTLKDGIVQAAGMTAVGDLSAAVTGILLGFNLPVTIPYWMVVIGSVFAIVVVKQLFGGIGCNFVNPALAGRAFMLASWPVAMTRFINPFGTAGAYAAVDAVSSATPLAHMKAGEVGISSDMLRDAFFGNVGGCIGETSALLLLAGGLYLVARKVIDLRITVSYILSFAVLVFLFGKSPFDINFVLYNLCTGGLILGAVYMATDYVTTPTTKTGHILFGLGCGILTFLIRNFGGYPEGVSYSILLMNIVTPIIDRYIRAKRFGGGALREQ